MKPKRLFNLGMGILCLSAASLSAQTEIPFKLDFEQESSQWLFANDSVNQWVRGNKAHNGDESQYGLYISNTQGASNKYEGYQPQVSHAYFMVQVPQGGALLEFDYRLQGEGDEYYGISDGLKVSIVDTAQKPIAGFGMPITDGQYVRQTSWTTAQLPVDGPSGSEDNGMRYIVFTWVNDASQANNPAVAIDNVTVRFDDCPEPENLKLCQEPDSLQATSAEICWDAPQTDVRLYEILLYPSYAPTLREYFHTTENSFLLQGLDELTYYSVQVRAIRNELSYSNFSNPLSFETPVRFPAPTHFAADVTDQGVTFSWQGEADAYVLSYKTTDAAVYTDVAANVHGITLDYEQLQPAQSYTARLRGVYGEKDSSAWTTEISFSTPCTGTESLPYAENFENWGPNAPLCWTVVDANQDGTTWKQGTESYGLQGSCATYPYSRSNAANDWLISPAISIDRACTLLFSYRSSSPTYDEKLSVYLSNTSPDIASLEQNKIFEKPDIRNMSYEQASIPLDEYVGETVYIGFKAQSEADMYGLFIDELSIVSCTAPKASIEAVAQNSASLIVSEAAQTVLVSYRSLPDGEWIRQSSQGSTVPLTGLNPQTEYEVQVRNLCSANDTSSPATLYFTTACGISSLPFAENFDNSGYNIPNCWDNSEGTASDSYKWTTEATDNGFYMLFNSMYAYEGDNSYLKSPSIETGSAEELELSFEYYNPEGESSPASILAVYILNDAGERDTLATNLPAAEWSHASFIFSDILDGAESIQIVFEAVGNYGYGEVSIDNVRLALPPSCPVPSDLQISQNAGHSASLSWISDADAFELRYFPTADSQNMQTLYPTASPAELTSLQGDTEYSVELRAICGAGDTSQAASLQFTTPVTCQTVSNLSVDSTSSSSVLISWSKSDAGNYQVRYGLADAESASTLSTKDTSILLTGLEAANQYQVSVRAICGEGDTSRWSSISFATQCAAQSLPVIESFEEGAMPFCWEEEIIVPNSGSTTTYWSVSSEESIDGGYSAVFNSYDLRQNAKARLHTPEFEASHDITLSFWFRHPSGSNPEERIIVGYQSSNGQETALDTLSGELDFTFHSYTVPDITDGRIYFEGISQYGQNMYIDDIRIEGLFGTDLAVMGIDPINPVSGVESVPISMQLQNKGTEPYSGSVNLALIDQNGNTVGTGQIEVEELASNDTLPYQFKADFPISGYGTFIASVQIQAEGDENPANDKASTEIEHYKPFSTPYSTTFAYGDSTLDYIAVQDLNKDDISWNRQASAGYQCTYSSKEASNDLLILPAILLRPGEYQIMAEVGGVDACFPENAALYMAGNTENMLLDSALAKVENLFASSHALTAKVAVDKEQVAYFGILACSERDQMGLNAISFSVTQQAYGIQADICQGETYLFNGQELSQSGTYTDTLVSASNTDSIVNLHLNVHPTYLFELDTVICEGSSLAFGGATYTESGEYEQAHTTAFGCDSTYLLRLEVLPKPEPPVIEEQTENGTRMLVSNYEDGNQWYKDNAAIEGENESRYILTSNGEYYATVNNGCAESAPSNIIKITDLANDAMNAAAGLALYPNPTRDKVNLRIQHGSILRVEIFSANGKRILAEENLSAQSWQHDVHAWAAGMYIVNVQTTEGYSSFKLQISK